MDDSASFTVRLDDKVSPGAKAAGASLGKLDGDLKKTGGGFASLASGAATAGAAVAAAIGAAAFAGGVALVDMTLKAVEAQNALMAFAKAEYVYSDSAKEAVDATYAVSASSALAQDKVFELSQKIMRAGVSIKVYADTLQAMADVSAVAGDQATKPIEKILKKVEQLGTFKIKDTDLKGSGIKMAEVYDQLAQKLGKSSAQIATDIKLGRISAEEGIAAMNAALENKFGAAAKDKMLDLNVQLAKAKENFSNMLKDVDTKPLGKALQQALSFLDGSTKSGKALRTALVGAMNGFFKAAAATIPYVEAFLLGVGIAALDVYIAMKPAIAAIGKALGFNNKSTESNMKAVATAGKVVGHVLAAMATNFAAVLVAGAFTFRGIQIGINAVSSAWPKMVAGVKSVYSTIKGGLGKAVDYVKGLPADFTAAGDAMIDGLIGAIKAGASKVVGAVTDMAKGATRAAKAALGIASPSKVFHEIGHFTAIGMAGGIGAGASKVHAATKSMLSIPANDNGRVFGATARPVASSSSSPAGGRSGGGNVFHVTFGAGAIVVHARDGQDARSIAAEVRREFLSNLEELATGTG